MRGDRSNKNGVPYGQTTTQPTAVPGSKTNPSRFQNRVRNSEPNASLVWDSGEASRPIDGMGGPVDGFIDSKEVQAGYNKGAFKIEFGRRPRGLIGLAYHDRRKPGSLVRQLPVVQHDYRL